MVIDLHAKSHLNICKRLEKVRKTVWSLEFTKSKAGALTKNQWSVTKLNLDV